MKVSNFVVSKYKSYYTPLIEILLIVIISAVTYLPNLSQASIYRDDWYYTMDRLIGGPGVFQEMFSIDRPARGPLFEAYYQLFGIQPFPYHMSSYVWRLLGGLAALWLFNLLWPGKRYPAFFMALLFTIYPGYTRWMEGFENQPRILSSFLEVLSIALTLKAITTTRRTAKIAAWLGAVITGWAYIALVDFSIGMEVFRLLCVFLIVNRNQQNLSWTQRGVAALRAWALAALIPVGFLVWRLFIFQNERPATDVGLQLGSLFSSPLLTGLWWLVRLFQSVANVAVLAWGSQLLNLFALRLFDILIGVLIAGAAVIFFLLANFLIKKTQESTQNQMSVTDNTWQAEAILIGLVGVLIGVLPVIVANRYVAFGGYSHYALPTSLASVALMGGVVFSISSHRIKLGIMSTLVLLAVLTHYSASSQVLHEEEVINNFWHQVAWRAPGIHAGTTLIVNYPSVNFVEDIDAVAGPANFIYFPDPTNQIPATYQLVALPQMDYVNKDVLTGGDKPYGYRTHIGTINYEKLLVISQPTEGACVHIIDPRWPGYSTEEPNQILLNGMHSKVENVLADSNSPRLEQSIFGPEPAHGWCYYYQKADLARQQGKWQEVIELANDAQKQNLKPNDQIEWMPFLQAYAIMDDMKNVKQLATRINTQPFYKYQACNTLIEMAASGHPFSEEMQGLTNKMFCAKGTTD